MAFLRRLDEENLEAASSILKPYQKKMDIWIDRTKFRSLAEDYRSNESPFSAIDPKDLVCVSLSGSKLYNVSLPDSDDDLACVFRWSSPVVSACVTNFLACCCEYNFQLQRDVSFVVALSCIEHGRFTYSLATGNVDLFQFSS